MLATFPQCNFPLEFPEKLSQTFMLSLRLPSRPLVVCHKLNETIVILNAGIFIFISFSVRLKVHVVSRTVSLAVIVHVKLRRNVLLLLYVRVISHSARLVLINLTLAAVTTTHSTAGMG